MISHSQQDKICLLKWDSQEQRSPHLIQLPVANNAQMLGGKLLQLPSHAAVAEEKKYSLIDIRTVYMGKKDEKRENFFFDSAQPRRMPQLLGNVASRPVHLLPAPLLSLPFGQGPNVSLLLKPALIPNPHLKEPQREDTKHVKLPMLVYPSELEKGNLHDQVEERDLRNAPDRPSYVKLRMEPSKGARDKRRKSQKVSQHDKSMSKNPDQTCSCQQSKQTSQAEKPPLAEDQAYSSNLYDLLLKAALYGNDLMPKDPFSFNTGQNMHLERLEPVGWKGQAGVQRDRMQEVASKPDSVSIPKDTTEKENIAPVLKHPSQHLSGTVFPGASKLHTKVSSSQTQADQSAFSEKVRESDLMQDIDFSWKNLYQLRNEVQQEREGFARPTQLTLVHDQGIQTDSPNAQSTNLGMNGSISVIPLVAVERQKSQGVQVDGNKEEIRQIFDHVRPAVFRLENNASGYIQHFPSGSHLSRGTHSSNATGSGHDEGIMQWNEEKIRERFQEPEFTKAKESSGENQHSASQLPASPKQSSSKPNFIPAALQDIKLKDGKIEVNLQEESSHFLSLVSTEQPPDVTAPNLRGMDASYAQSDPSVPETLSPGSGIKIPDYSTKAFARHQGLDSCDSIDREVHMPKDFNHGKVKTTQMLDGGRNIRDDLKTMSMQLDALENLQRYLEADLHKSKLLLGTVEAIQDVYDPQLPSRAVEAVRAELVPSLSVEPGQSALGSLLAPSTPRTPISRISYGSESIRSKAEGNEDLQSSIEFQAASEDLASLAEELLVGDPLQELKVLNEKRLAALRGQNTELPADVAKSEDPKGRTFKLAELHLPQRGHNKESDEECRKAELEQKRQRLLRWMKKKRRKAMDAYLTELDSKRQAEARPFQSPAKPGDAGTAKGALNRKEREQLISNKLKEDFTDRLTSTRALLNDMKSADQATRTLLRTRVTKPSRGRTERKVTTFQSATARIKAYMAKKKKPKKAGGHSPILTPDRGQSLNLRDSGRSDLSEETWALVKDLVVLETGTLGVPGDRKKDRRGDGATRRSTRFSDLEEENQSLRVTEEHDNDLLNLSLNSGRDFVTRASYERYKQKRSKLVRETVKKFASVNKEDGDYSRGIGTMVGGSTLNGRYRVRVEDLDGDVHWSQDGERKEDSPFLLESDELRDSSKDVFPSGVKNGRAFSARERFTDDIRDIRHRSDYASADEGTGDSLTADLLAQADAFLATGDFASDTSSIAGRVSNVGSIDWNEVDNILNEN